MAEPRYIVGIDLGTTNSALAYLPLGEEGAATRILPVPQVVHPGELAGRPLLPSYLYLPHPSEFPEGDGRMVVAPGEVEIS